MSRARRNRHRAIKDAEKNPILFIDEIVHISTEAYWANLLRIGYRKEKEKKNGY